MEVTNNGTTEETSLLLKKPEKVKISTKLAYGIGEFGPMMIGVVQGFFLQAFLLEVAEISPYQAGTVVLAAQIWDGVCDPIAGRLSDSTRSRIGRRRPWLLGAAIPVGAFYWAIWQVPKLSQNMLFGYYVAVNMLITMAISCISVPYGALLPELSSDYDERTSLSMSRAIFGLLAGIVCAPLHSFLVTVYPITNVSEEYDYIKGYALSAHVLAPLAALSPFITAVAIREKPFKGPIESIKSTCGNSVRDFFRGLKHTFTNRAFNMVILTNMCAWTVINFVQGNILLWVKYVLKAEDMFSYLLMALQLSATISMFVNQWISTIIGKKFTYMIGASVLVVSLTGLFFVTEGFIWVSFLIAVCAGFGVSTAMLIPLSMIPDVTDLDNLRTGKQREGDLFSIFTLSHKIASGVALAASSYALGYAGYINPVEQAKTASMLRFSEDLPPDEHQPAAVILTLRLIVSFVPVAFILVSMISAYFYPITKESHAMILEQLSSLKGNKT
eukprot:TRINITY_DN5920_c0_g1_i1.p1 TRINITY_DN5920_c0_g1~~TRINITY_DN5920_c0_g1_i1.p1  ORF type:complete len:500 (+),score=81.86 TRINITY_DN5920_c0_g1_i1:138-1637(+)